MSTNTYERQSDITPVCSNDYCRSYFKQKGLIYNDLTSKNLALLSKLLRKELRAAYKNKETSIELRLSKKITIDINPYSWNVFSCFLYLNSNYFLRRECISFNADGFIGFAGWADDGNTNPIRRAFIAWCDEISKEKAC